MAGRQATYLFPASPTARLALFPSEPELCVQLGRLLQFLTISAPRQDLQDAQLGQRPCRECEGRSGTTRTGDRRTWVDWMTAITVLACGTPAPNWHMRHMQKQATTITATTYMASLRDLFCGRPPRIAAAGKALDDGLLYFPIDLPSMSWPGHTARFANRGFEPHLSWKEGPPGLLGSSCCCCTAFLSLVWNGGGPAACIPRIPLATHTHAAQLTAATACASAARSALAVLT